MALTRRLILSIVLGIALVGGVTVAVRYLRQLGPQVRASYALDEVAFAVGTHLRKTGGRWPTDWDDLSELLDSDPEEISDLVDLEFGIGTEELKTRLPQIPSGAWKPIKLRAGVTGARAPESSMAIFFTALETGMEPAPEATREDR
jgi:hypothetical protein